MSESFVLHVNGAEYEVTDAWLGESLLDTLRDRLAPEFRLDDQWNLPFLIREHSRKYQWSVALATRWLKQ